MKAALYRRHGRPEDVIELVDLPPETPREGEVLIDVEAVSLWPQDLYAMQGAKGPEAFPVIPGNKAVGIVRAVGAGVSAFRPGDRVNVGGLAPGTWRQQVCLGAENLLPIPPGVDAAQVSLIGNMLTAYYALVDLVPLQAGDWIIQNGANSSCGQFLIQLARRRGIRTVNVVRRAEVMPYLRSIGADVVLVDGPDLPHAVATATGDAKVVLAIDMIAGAATERLGRCLAPGGTVACYGHMSTESAQLAVSDLMFRDIKLVGYFMGRSRRTRSIAEFGRAHDEVVGLAAAGVLFAQIAGHYSLDQVRDLVIHEAKSAAEKPGKLILWPNGVRTLPLQ